MAARARGSLVEDDLTWVVPTDLEGSRLDVGLRRLATGLTRRQVQKLCFDGRVWVDNRRSQKGSILHAGAVVVVRPRPPTVVLADPSLHLEVRLETCDLVIVRKPGGLPATATLESATGTLVNALLARYPEMAGIGSPLEAGLIHRLDTGTSGLLIAARHAESLLRLRHALKGGQIHKEYLGLATQARRLPSNGCLDAPLARSASRSPRVVALTPALGATDPPATSIATIDKPTPTEGIHRERLPSSRGRPRPARTSFEIIEQRGEVALVRIWVSCARRHQIRAHFSGLGCPLVNDVQYGAAAEPVLPPCRHALHAHRVSWEDNDLGSGFDVTDPLAEDLAAWFEKQ